MIARRQPPVKQNLQSFLHCRRIAENRRKTQKRCKFNLQTGCGLELPQSKPSGFASSLWEGAFGMTGKFAAQVQSGLPGVPLPSCRCAAIHLPQGDGFSGGGKVVGIAQRRPLGGAVEHSETEGVSTETPPVCCADSPLWDGALGMERKLSGKLQSLRFRQRLSLWESWHRR